MHGHGWHYVNLVLYSICLSYIDGRLRDFFAAMKEESSVDEILFKARYVFKIFIMNKQGHNNNNWLANVLIIKPRWVCMRVTVIP